MTKKVLGVLVASVMTAGVLSLIPTALAQTPPTPPEVANIEDPAGDANHHSWATGTGGGLNFLAADMLKIWFDNDAENLFTYIQTSAGQDSQSLTFQVFVDPGVGADCLSIEATTAGAYSSDTARIGRSGDCGSGSEVLGTMVTEELEDGTAVHTITLPRSADPGFADGGVLKTPNALVGENLSPASRRAGIIDDTEVGTDYAIRSGDGPPAPGGTATPTPAPTASASPGGGEEQPKAKKKCKKLKGKKKKKCLKKNKKPSGPPPCPAYVPGEEGVDLPINLVTDAHTAEAPLEITVPTETGVPFVGVTSTFQNIQVDPTTTDTGLYAAFEFEIVEDYDIYLQYADGSVAAQAAGFNQFPFVPGETDGTGSGGHSEQGGEFLDGVRTPDCGGYTLQIDSFLAEGGDRTLKLWLGEAVYDPPPPGSPAAEALALLGLR